MKSEESLIEETRERLKAKYPKSPVSWAITYAQRRAEGVAKSIGGPFWVQEMTRRIGLERELDRAENYLTGTSRFLELEDELPEK